MACPLMDGDPEHLIWKLDKSWVSNPPPPPLPSLLSQFHLFTKYLGQTSVLM